MAANARPFHVATYKTLEGGPERYGNVEDSKKADFHTKAAWYTTAKPKMVKNYPWSRIEIPGIVVLSDSETYANYRAFIDTPVGSRADHIKVDGADVREIMGSIKAFNVNQDTGDISMDYQAAFPDEFA